jgi:hypothetical protein
MGFGSRVDDLINGLHLTKYQQSCIRMTKGRTHGEVPGHELAHRVQTESIKLNRPHPSYSPCIQITVPM